MSGIMGGKGGDIMANKKDLIIAILATFCLTATLFTIIPTRSSTDRYDPWVDINDDGQINLSDIYAVAKAYGSTGNPTKNVTVTAYSYSEWQEVFDLPPFGQRKHEFDTAGYRRLTIGFQANDTIRVSIRFRAAGMYTYHSGDFDIA